MKWPWQKRETRQSGGDFSDAVVRLIEAQAAGTAADAGSTAAVEAASGALSRAFAAAKVVLAPPGRSGRRLRVSWRRWGATWCAPAIPCTSSTWTAWAT